MKRVGRFAADLDPRFCDGDPILCVYDAESVIVGVPRASGAAIGMPLPTLKSRIATLWRRCVSWARRLRPLP